MNALKALVKVTPGFGNLEIRNVERPLVRKGQVLVEVKAAGICGSDVKHYIDGSSLKTPIILGHEFSGEVVEVGNDVEEWQVGDRIISETSAYVCERCYYCNNGDYHLCNERKGLGSGVNGAFTKYVAVPEKLLHKTPEDLSYEEAATIQPCADVVNAVIRKSNVFPGDTVVVLGPGPMGLLTTQVVKSRGAVRVVQTGHEGVRLNISKDIGADITIPVEKEDPVSKIMGLTKSRGADVVFETSGSIEAASQTFDMVRKRGQIIFIAAPNEPIKIDIRKILGKALIVKGSIMSKRIDYEWAIELISSGAVRVKPIITHILPITEWKKAFDYIIDKKTAGKVILTPV